MSVFHYRAYTAGGQTVSGALEADNLEMVESRLRAGGGWLLEAKEGAPLASVSGTKTSSTRIKGSELIAFFVQMSLLLKAGVTLVTALQRLGEDNKGTRLGSMLDGLREQVAIGVPLNQAMGNYSRVFSRPVMAIVEAGEASGRLPEVFESLCAYYEWLDQLSSDIRQALIYPLVVIGTSLTMVLLLFTLVVPSFVTLLVDLRLQVPLLTRIVMGISNALLGHWLILLLVAIGVPVALKMALRHPGFAREFDRVLMKLPIFGELVAMFGLSRFSSNLSMLTQSGITLVRGLEICGSLVGNRAIEEAIAAARLSVLEGAPLHRCLAQHPVFPRMLITMIATGEASGSLDFALKSAADYYNKIIPRRIKIIFAIFDPVMMLSLIALVGIVALAVILPILQLWGVK